MDQPNSGDDLFLWCPDQLEWVEIGDIRLEEAKTYRWRTANPAPFRLLLNGIPQPMMRSEDGWEGELAMPFQSGQITFHIHRDGVREISSYLYSDSRKLTEAEYQRMITDILQEAKVCFQHDGAALSFQYSGVDRSVSIPQWDYVERSFHRLTYLFREIQASPMRVLKVRDQWMQRDKVKHVTPAMIAWAERHPGHGATPELPVPSMILAGTREESCDVYENRVVSRQLRELLFLLGRYAGSGLDKIAAKANRYRDIVTRWLQSGFLKQVAAHKGTITISQGFRKHPIYRGWFQWFQELNHFDDIKLGLKSSIPLKDTYHLYEIWVFMQLVGRLREQGLVMDASSLFAMDREGLVLTLSEKKEHRVKLIQGGSIAYQRWFTRKTEKFGTYTHGMKPDIVLELNERLYIFDPKYRLDHNLPMALGEMHKYRDGIVRQCGGAPAVEEVYIITPASGTDNVRFFEDEYRMKHMMGAYSMNPGGSNGEIHACLERILHDAWKPTLV
ncbi:DUF2357 domain-containing protein [Paenibacillus sp. OAS669]|uniref:DUF2357 domain-containing protein n=1 Tax=Paenibacillus sp. OAS669 TaxID=2663821 RepID=UPI00178BBFEC|nr:DUF2357 domain-containing protein [Paenibacillus sp. OAS669]MBE1444737.1 hypothetical protein [Paenibacillus sp. OAS669]